MGKINVKDFANLFELSAISVGILFGQIGLNVDLETETFEGQSLIDKLRGDSVRTKINTILKKKINVDHLKTIEPGHRLRGQVLPLFRDAGLKVEWWHLMHKNLNTTIRAVSTTGKSILIGVRSSNSARQISTFNFVITAPFQPWYCLIMNSTEFVHLCRKEEFRTIYDDGKSSKYSINTNIKYDTYLFKNQIEVFKEELESL